MTFVMPHPRRFLTEPKEVELLLEDYDGPKLYVSADGAVRNSLGQYRKDVEGYRLPSVKIKGQTFSRRLLVVVAFRKMKLNLLQLSRLTLRKVTGDAGTDHLAGKYIPFFDHPIFDIRHNGKTFRRIPGLNKYAIARDGSLLTIEDKKVRLAKTGSIGVTPDLEARTVMRVNQLLAYAYVPLPTNTRSVYAVDAGGYLVWCDWTVDKYIPMRSNHFTLPYDPKNNNTQAAA